MNRLYAIRRSFNDNEGLSVIALIRDYDIHTFSTHASIKMHKEMKQKLDSGVISGYSIVGIKKEPVIFHTGNQFGVTATVEVDNGDDLVRELVLMKYLWYEIVEIWNPGEKIVI